VILESIAVLDKTSHFWNFWIPRFSNFNSRLQSAVCRH